MVEYLGIRPGTPSYQKKPPRIDVLVKIGDDGKVQQIKQIVPYMHPRCSEALKECGETITLFDCVYNIVRKEPSSRGADHEWLVYELQESPVNPGSIEKSVLMKRLQARKKR